MESKQVKATAEDVDEAVRELPDPNLVRYIYNFLFQCSLEATLLMAVLAIYNFNWKSY
jgi:hypothetical protein